MSIFRESVGDYDFFRTVNLPLIKSAVNEVVNNSQVPIELAITCALAAATVVTQGLIDVRLPTNNVVPVSLMMMLIAKSGERKTSVEKKFFDAIRRFERDLISQHDEKLKSWSIEHGIWVIKQRALKVKIGKMTASGEDSAKVEVEWAELIRSEPQKPIAPKIIYEDSTSQALFHGLNYSSRDAALVSSEGGSIMDGGAFSDLSKLNSIWSGSDITVDRKTSDSYMVSNARLLTFVMVQPSVISKFIKRRGDQAKGSGLMARFICCKARSTQGQRVITNGTSSNESLSKYEQRAHELLVDKYRSTRPDDNNREVICFSSEAQLAWLDYFNYIERRIRPGGLYENAGDHASKLAENVARVAAVLHYFEGFKGDISTETLDIAIGFCDEASRDYLEIFESESQDEVNADILIDWLYSDSGFRKFGDIKKNHIRQYGPNLLRSKEALDSALSILEGRGKIEIIYREGGTCYVTEFARI